MSLRNIERGSIRDFLRKNRDHLTGRVLDFGCGDQPYRDVVIEAGGRYFGYDQSWFPGSVVKENVGPDFPMANPEWDSVICTQVIQYVTYPPALIRMLKLGLKDGGHLLITGPTNWPVVEQEDLWRFTARGVGMLLSEEFETYEVGYRGSVSFEGEDWSLGWWAIAKKVGE